MRFRLSMIWVVLLSLVFTSGVRAQSVVDPSTVRQALVAQQAVDEANQQAVLKVLARSEVRDIAAEFGLSVRDAESAVKQLSGDQLAELATSARAIDADLAGGQTVTITISVVALLLIILLVVLIAD